MKRFKTTMGILAATVLLAASLVGCMNQAQRNQPGQTKPQTQGMNDNITEGTGRIQGDADRSNTARDGMNNTGNMREAQNIANALTGKYNIRSANVFVTDSNAYVACDINQQVQGQLTEQVKNDISNEVRRVDPSIQRVFVSADADTFQRFRGFADQLRSGHPVRGLADQFTETVRRVWPEAK